MMPPLQSTVTLLSEFFVTAAVFFVFYQGYRHNRFFTKTAIAALAYETLFNITYMTARLFSTGSDIVHSDPAFIIALAAFHGTLSLIMFAALILFFVIAYKRYKTGINYFRQRNRLTTVFLIFWSISILSGFSFYVAEYFLNH